MRTWYTIVFAALLAVSLGNQAASADEKPAPPSADKAPAAQPPAKAAWKAGDKVDVEWEKDWWKAVIMEVQGADAFKVHYVGHSDGWNEVVKAERVRARTAEAKRGPSSEKD